MALPILRTVTETRGASLTTSFTVNMPSSRPDGRLFVLSVSCNGSDQISDPSGWTRILRTNQASVVSAWIGYRIGSSEPSTYSIVTDAASSRVFSATILGIDRFNSTTPINTNSSAVGSSVSPASASMTTSANDCLALWTAHSENVTNVQLDRPAGPSGYASIAQISTGNTAQTTYGKYAVSSGSVSGATGTYGTSGNWIVHAIAVAGNLSAPEITSATSAVASYALDGETGIVLTGTAFESSKGSGKLELWNNSSGSTKTVQTTTAWSDTSITFTANLGSISQGRVYGVVTTDGGLVSEPFRIVVVSSAPDTKIAEVRVSANTSSGDQDITSGDISGITPKAVLFRMIRATADGATDQIAHCIGAAVSSSSRFVATMKSEDAAGSTNQGRCIFNDGCLAMADPASAFTLEAKADFVSFISGGCRINWSDPPPAAHQIVATFFCGTLVQAAINNINPIISWRANNSTDHIHYPVSSSVGDPDLLISTNVTLSTFGTSSSGSTSFSWGYAALPGFALDASPQCAYAKFAHNDAVSTEAADSIVSTTGTVNFCNFGSINGGLKATRWYMDRDIGYRLFSDQTFTPTTRAVSFLELVLPGTRCWVGAIDPRTSSGSQSITFPGWRPQWVNVTQSMVATLGTNETDDDANTLAISSFTATTQQSTGFSVDDGSAGSDTASYIDDKAIFLRDAPTGVLFDGTWTSFDSTGWTWNYSTANGTQRRWVGVAVEGFIPPVIVGAQSVGALGVGMPSYLPELVRWDYTNPYDGHIEHNPSTSANARVAGLSLFQIGFDLPSPIYRGFVSFDVSKNLLQPIDKVELVLTVVFPSGMASKNVYVGRYGLQSDPLLDSDSDVFDGSDMSGTNYFASSQFRTAGTITLDLTTWKSDIESSILDDIPYTICFSMQGETGASGSATAVRTTENGSNSPILKIYTSAGPVINLTSLSSQSLSFVPSAPVLAGMFAGVRDSLGIGSTQAAQASTAVTLPSQESSARGASVPAPALIAASLAAQPISSSTGAPPASPLAGMLAQAGVVVGRTVALPAPLLSGALAAARDAIAVGAASAAPLLASMLAAAQPSAARGVLAPAGAVTGAFFSSAGVWARGDRAAALLVAGMLGSAQSATGASSAPAASLAAGAVALAQPGAALGALAPAPAVQGAAVAAALDARASGTASRADLLAGLLVVAQGASGAVVAAPAVVSAGAVLAALASAARGALPPTDIQALQGFPAVAARGSNSSSSAALIAGSQALAGYAFARGAGKVMIFGTSAQIAQVLRAVLWANPSLETAWLIGDED